MKKNLIAIGVVILLLAVGLSGCNESSIQDDIENKILGSWERNDGTIWTFYENGTILKSFTEYGLFWTTYEINEDKLTEYHKSDYTPTFAIEFEGEDKLILTNTDNDEIFYFIKYM
jgi:hypothetical protein